MFGLEVLDVVIGLMFVYLLLSLLATAINEYVSAVVNLRGKELARGLGRLLDDLDEKDALKNAFDGVGRKTAAAADKLANEAQSLTEQFYNHPLISPLATRRGVLFRKRGRAPRLPSYIPARTFAQALLDVLEVRDKDASLNALLPAADPAAPGTGTPGSSTTAQPKAASPAAGPNAAAVANLARVLQILKRESPQDIVEHVGDLKGWLENANLPEDAKMRLLEGLTASQTQLQKLHDSVEVWFNNSMDRVSGAYKRNIQGWLFLIGLLIAVAANADTIDMWNRLAEDDKLREGMAARAIASMASLDSAVYPRAAQAPPDTTGADSAAGGTTTADTPARTAPAADTTGTDSTPAQPDTVTPAAGQAGTGTPPAPDTTLLPPPATAPAADSVAREAYHAARARLDSMELRLGWTKDDARRAGLWRRGADKPDWFPFDTGGFYKKVLGLLLTAIALALGAPFWFDLLNKVISIRAAGRSPVEKPKSPEGSPKRPAEHTPR